MGYGRRFAGNGRYSPANNALVGTILPLLRHHYFDKQRFKGHGGSGDTRAAGRNHALADYQSAGRGRLDRRWEAAPARR